jgi:ABC-type Fe3+ transport system substrate-binding protein
VIVYDKLRVRKEDVDTYEELADPKNKGKVCLRSGSHPYNLSLFGAVTEHLGEQKAEAWLKIIDVYVNVNSGATHGHPRQGIYRHRRRIGPG